MTVLQFTNSYGEKFWFTRLGVQWPHRPERRLIDGTTANRKEARTFATPEEAREVLVVAGEPSGWAVETLLT